MTQIDLSIIIPTFHREEYVVRAVESVLRLEGMRIEVVVVDDSPEGSAEQHLAHLHDPRFRYEKRAVPTGGKPALVRNDAAAAARGRYLYFLDDDDTAEPATLVRMVESLSRTGHGVAIGAVQPFGPESSEVVTAERAHYANARRVMGKLRTRYMLTSYLLFRSSIIVCSACMIRREAFEQLRGFDPALPLYEDVAMYIRAIRRYGYDYVDQSLLHRRTGEPSLIQNERDSIRTRESYGMIHRGYREEFGLGEYLALKLLGLALPR